MSVIYGDPDQPDFPPMTDTAYLAGDSLVTHAETGASYNTEETQRVDVTETLPYDTASVQIDGEEYTADGRDMVYIIDPYNR